ncbi:MAG: hypothetical protein CM15mP109_09070 [Candidatus Dadabacteria bacterium]|nr:MAG: hypothetical protein CM15mP109_09070 [Candidatus Dadabacteria bacterium]
MGTKLKTNKGKIFMNWGQEICNEIIKDLKSLKSNTIINLASNEYFGLS